MPNLKLFEEAKRQLTICNSCRYCEGYCAVFPAIEIRRVITDGDVPYLANLCHDCRACFYACMYSPPHEFAINIPHILAEARIATYRRWCWPGVLSDSVRDRWLEWTLGFTAWASVCLLAAILISPRVMLSRHLAAGSFYKIIPYRVILIGGTVLFAYAICVWAIGGIRFWSSTGDRRPRANLKAMIGAVFDSLGLSYLKGGGPGCYYPKDRPSFVRRAYHTLTAWGFLSALLSTSTAAIYQDFFHWLPPFGYASAPVVFGIIGGIAMIIGTMGLIWFKLKSDKTPNGDHTLSMDYTFLVVLWLTAVSGMLTLAFRATSAMGSLLVLHLGFVAALFISAPYGKFVHLVYRLLALIKYRIERIQAV
jgi:citrate/tricarballylate utilization protein